MIVASVALVGQFPVFFGSAPLWSLTVIAICSAIIYGLVVYGGADSAPTDTIEPKQKIHQ